MHRAQTQPIPAGRESTRDATGAKPAAAPSGHWINRLARLSGGAFLAAGFVLAFALRLFHLDDPPLDFHPARQYRSALIARAIYLRQNPELPAEHREAALLNGDQQGVLEPPLLEGIAALGYRLAGRESLWIPRLASVACWLGAAGTLHRLVASLVPGAGALAATTYFLFLPYGVLASRSFQPESLMLFTLAAALLAIRRHQLRPGRGRFAAAVALTALAAFVKPVAAFPLLGVFGLLTLEKTGWRGLFRDPSLYLYGLAGFLPAVVYYAVVFARFSAQGLAPSSFMPHILPTGFFWSGWARMAARVAGLAPLLIAAAGWAWLLRARAGARPWTLGLLLGYLAMGVFFTFEIHTHDYYQLQLLLPVALGLAPAANALSGLVRWERLPPLLRVAAAGLASLALAWHAWTSRWSLEVADLSAVRAAEEIGPRVRHSTRTVFLAPYYGKPLQYHGGVAGENWPEQAERAVRRFKNLADPDAAGRLAAMRAATAPDYFIVADLREWAAQPDLRACLDGGFPLLASTDAYRIYDLRRTREPGL